MRIEGIGVVALLMVAVVVAQDSPTSRPSFDEFLEALKTEAVAKGIRQTTLDRALDGLIPEPVVVARDRAQPEQTMSLDEYLARRVTPRLVTLARTKAAEHKALLSKVEAAYGVPASIMTAVWGMESNFGQFTGTYGTVRALATLAYDGRRPLFRTELFNALRILDRGDLEVDMLKGSWAGAMGQPQFLPSTFLEHAVDFDGDGKIDIWTSTADVLASMANYLNQSGWKKGERWGREVAIGRPAIAEIDRDVPMRTTGCRAVRTVTVPRPLSEWRNFGVTVTGGNRVPDIAMPASLVRGTRRSFLVYENYGALLAYNCSNSYAVSVGLLADKIAAS